MSDRLSMRRGLGRPPTFSVGWHDAIFEHYEIVRDADVEPLLPSGLTLDRHTDGKGYLSVVSFRMNDMRWLRRVRLPLSHTYPQINVRVYVRSGDKFGVFFLRNYVSNRLAAWAGKLLYGVPYVYQGVVLGSAPGEVACSAQLRGGVQHRVAGHVGERLAGHETEPTSLRYFLCERYPLFTARRGTTYEAAMLHAPWHLYRLDEPQRTHACLQDLGLDKAADPVAEVHYSPGVDTLMWPPFALGSMPALQDRNDAPHALSLPPPSG